MNRINELAALKAEIQAIWRNQALTNADKIQAELRLTAPLAKRRSRLFEIYEASRLSWRASASQSS